MMTRSPEEKKRDQMRLYWLLRMVAFPGVRERKREGDRVRQARAEVRARRAAVNRMRMARPGRRERQEAVNRAWRATPWGRASRLATYAKWEAKKRWRRAAKRAVAMLRRPVHGDS